MSLSLGMAEPGMQAEGVKLSGPGMAPGERAPGLFDARASKKAGKKGFFSSILSRLRSTEANSGAASGRTGFRPKSTTGTKEEAEHEAGTAAAGRMKKGGKPLSRDGEPLRLKDSQDWRKRDRTSRRADGPDASAQNAASLLQGARLAKSRDEKAITPGKNGEIEARGAPETTQKNKPRIDVYDRRTKKEVPAAKAAEAKSESAAEPARKSADGAKDILVELREGKAQAETPKSAKAEGAAKGDGFAAQLAERLQDTYNAEIVRQGSFVLRDGGAGTIRLLLKPESLGNVKVRLELADNSITGSIVVESEEARDAFQADIERLTKDFIDSGFQDAKLEVSVDSGAGGRAGAGAQSAPGYLSPRGGMAGAFEAMDAGSGGFFAAGSPGTVDILV